MVRKIKVLWFSNTPANGSEILMPGRSGSGSWLQTLDIAIQSSVELHIAFYHSEDIEFSVGQTHYYGIKRYRNFATKIVFRFMERFFDYVRDEYNLEAYLKVIDSIKPDLIHIHGTENSFGCIVNKLSIPVVVSIQGLVSEVELFFSKGLGERMMSVRNFNLKSIINIFFPTNFYNSKLRFRKMAAIERKNLLLTKYIIGRTFWDKRVTRLLAPKSKYFHNHEIMRADFKNIRWSPPPNTSKLIKIHTTSDNVYYKGLETVCFAILILNQYGYACSWSIAGVNPDDLIVKILSKKFGSKILKESVNFLGKQSSEELIKSMLASNVFVMPSNIENSPNSLCEAMLLGMPCIATSAGGTSEFLNEKNGVIVQPGDSYSIAAAVIELYGDISKSIFISNNARQAAMSRHDSSRVVLNLLEIYKSILSGK